MSVIRPRSQETTAVGAAYLAGLAEGMWESLDDLAANWRLDQRFDAAVDRAEADARYETWRRAVTRSHRWASD